MNILINAQFYDGNHITGIGNYAQELIFQLSKIDKKNLYTIYCKNPQFSNSEHIVFKPSISVLSSGLARLLWENLILKIKIIWKKPDVFHSLNYTIPLFISKKTKVIATVQDLTWIKHPIFFSKFTRMLAVLRIKYTCKRADQIITISNSTKNDLINFIGCNESKIKVIYLGADQQKYKIISSKENLSKVKTKYDLPDKYLFWIGSLRKNKNLKNMIKAFLVSEKSKLHNYSFVLAGKKSNGYDEIEELIQNNPNVLYKGLIDDKDLPIVYNLSSGLLFVSLYEGFGLPIVESLACGVPVITSNVSSMPEIITENEFLCKPNNIEDITAKIDYLVDFIENGHVNRDNLRKKAHKFQYVYTAVQTLDIYNGENHK